MWRVAIYAREAPGRAGQSRLDRQIARLAAQHARHPIWHYVARYGDLDVGPPGARPGLSRLIADAPGTRCIPSRTGHRWSGDIHADPQPPAVAEPLVDASTVIRCPPTPAPGHWRTFFQSSEEHC